MVPPPSSWVVRFASLVPADQPVLDIACGGGRHTRYFVGRGHPVLAVDRDLAGVTDLAEDRRVELVAFDLEAGRKPPFANRRFGGVVVTNYLHRPILSDIVAAVAPGGALLYETFALGNERYGRPRRRDFLLEPGELLRLVDGRFRVIAYEDLVIERGGVDAGGHAKAAVQRVAAVRSSPDP